jgi:hypothetical protein
MTHKDNLIKLLDAVVKERPPRKEVYWRADPCGLGQSRRFLSDAARGDMNAVLTFVAEVLPGWFYLIGSGPKGIDASVTKKKQARKYFGQADTPARALLIAALNALIEMEQDQ